MDYSNTLVNVFVSLCYGAFLLGLHVLMEMVFSLILCLSAWV